MKMYQVIILLISTMLTSIANAMPLEPRPYQRLNNGVRHVMIQGRATVPNGEADAILRMFCKEGKGGAIGLEMYVFKKGEVSPNKFIDKNKTFNFKDFEGEATANRSLVRVTVRGEKGNLTINTNQTGMFSRESGGFVFSVGGPNNSAANPAQKIFKAIKNGGRSILIQVTDSRDPNVSVQGEFDTKEVKGAIRKIMAGYWQP